MGVSAHNKNDSHDVYQFSHEHKCSTLFLLWNSSSEKTDMASHMSVQQATSIAICQHKAGVPLDERREHVCHI